MLVKSVRPVLDRLLISFVHEVGEWKIRTGLYNGNNLLNYSWRESFQYEHSVWPDS